MAATTGNGSTNGKCDVGGVLLDQPFKIRRLGHFGLDFRNPDENLPIYQDLLGFQTADFRDPFAGKGTPEKYKDIGDPKSYFMRYNTDHHAFAFSNLALRKGGDTQGLYTEGVTVGQISWQVGSLAEVINGDSWMRERQCHMIRVGRAGPGSNWHSYLMDPDGHKNEILYGIEQIGWNGHSKPKVMGARGFHDVPDLPQISEYQEIEDALAEGVDMQSGYRYTHDLAAKHDVQGILLPRPFRIVKIGPIGLFVTNMTASLDFYCTMMGFLITEEVDYQGHRCVFLRNNTEHHSLVLYPIELREALGLSEHTTTAGFGLQVANYTQLRNAREFLAENGVRVTEMPLELTPGLDYSFLAFDADGHAMQFYCAMEQLGWDAKPRPAASRRKITPGVWPESLDALSDSYMGEPFLGPWG